MVYLELKLSFLHIKAQGPWGFFCGHSLDWSCDECINLNGLSMLQPLQFQKRKKKPFHLFSEDQLRYASIFFAVVSIFLNNFW